MPDLFDEIEIGEAQPDIFDEAADELSKAVSVPGEVTGQLMRTLQLGAIPAEIGREVAADREFLGLPPIASQFEAPDQPGPSTTGTYPGWKPASFSPMRPILNEIGEQSFTSPVEIPQLPQVSKEAPVQPWERNLARTTVIGNVLSAIKPELAAQFNRTAFNQAAGLLNFVTSPGGATISAVAPAAPTTASVLFTADMLKSLYEQGKEAYANWDQMSGEQKLDAAMNIGATAGMAGLAGAHGYTGVRNRIAPPVPPKIYVPGTQIQGPPGAPAPRIEPPSGIERATSAQAEAAAKRMQRTATAAYEPLKLGKPVLPTGPEVQPDTVQTVPAQPQIGAKSWYADAVEYLRAKATGMETKEQIKNLFPQLRLSNENAKALALEAWGENWKPGGQVRQPGRIKPNDTQSEGGLPGSEPQGPKPGPVPQQGGGGEAASPSGVLQTAPTLTPEQQKAATIKERLSAGLRDEDVRVTVQRDPELPQASYVQVDDVTPGMNNPFSANPETLRAAGMDIPESSQLLALPAGQYTLAEAKRLLAQKPEGKAAETGKTVTVFHGGEGGSGTSGAWFTTNPARARTFGKNTVQVEIPVEVLEKLQAESAAAGRPKSDIVLPDEWVKKAKRVEIPENVIDLDKAEEAGQIADVTKAESAKPEPKAETAKEPWQMTRNTIVGEGYIYTGMTTDRALNNQVAAWQRKVDALPDSKGAREGLDRAQRKLRLANEHRVAVQQALHEGKPVPVEVLADYPDLAKPKPETIPPVSEPKAPQAETKPAPSETMKAEGEKPSVAKAVQKVETQVQEVAKTEGQRPAKEVKSELVSRIEEEQAKLPKLEGEVTFSQPKTYNGQKRINVTKDTRVDGSLEIVQERNGYLWRVEKTDYIAGDKYPVNVVQVVASDLPLTEAKAFADEQMKLGNPWHEEKPIFKGTRTGEEVTKAQRKRVAAQGGVFRKVPETVTIEIPGDGTFTIPKTRYALDRMLRRAKALKTKAEEPFTEDLPSQKQGKTWASEAEVKPESAPASPAPATETTMAKAETEADIQGTPPSVNAPPLTPQSPSPLTAPVKPISEIIRELSKGLGVPIRFGRLITPKYGGYFVKLWNLITSKRPNDMPTVSHEAGHKLDALWKFSSDRTIATELNTLGDNRTAGSMSSWTPSKNKAYKLGEGVAEFTRYWLTDPAHAQQVAPNMFRRFEETLNANTDYGAVMRQAQNDIRLWRTAPAQARLRSSISTSNPIPAHRGLSGLTRDLVDDLHFLRLAVDDAKAAGPVSPMKNPYQLARTLRGAYGAAANFIQKGVVDFRSKSMRLGTSLEDALKPVAGQIADFRDWIVAKRAAELHQQGKQTGLLNSDVQDVLNRFQNKPEFQEAFDKIKAWEDALLQYAVDAQLIGPDAARLWRQMNQDYVPFHRVMEVGAGEEPAQAGAGTGRGLNVGRPGSFKKLSGSKRDIIDPLETMVKNAYTIITASEKNAIHTALADLTRVQDMGKWVERVAVPKERVKVELERIREQLEDAGADLDNVPDDLLMEFWKPSGRAPWGENIIKVNRAGKNEFYRLNKDLFETFHALDQESAGTLLRMAAFPAQLLRAGVTLTPDFATFNALRDTLSSAIISKYSHVPFLHTIKGLAALIGNPKLVGEWAASGGRQSVEASFFDRAKLQKFLAERITKDLTPAERALVWAKSPLTLLRVLTGTLEEATRLGEYQNAYKALRKQGMTEGEARRQAAFEARDLQDFAKGGAQTKTLRMLAAFWNAALQGNIRLAQAFKERPVATTLKGMAFITIPKLLEQAVNWDNEDYWDRPQWERDLFFLLPYGKDANGKTQFIRLPTPFEVGLIFGTVPGRFMQWLKGNNPDAFRGLAGQLAKSTVPNPIPQAVLTVLETMMGKQGYSIWRGRPIVPESLKDTAPALQFTEQQSLTARHAGDLLGISPAKIDYLIQGLTGGVGKQVVHQGIDRVISAATGEPRTAMRTGPLSRFVSTPAGVSSDSVERFYVALNEAREAESLKKAGRETGGKERHIQRLEEVAKEMGELRRKARQTADPVQRQKYQLQIIEKAKRGLKSAGQ